MPITQVDIEGAEKLLEDLMGNQEAAESYSKDPEGWLNEHGYADLNPEAVAQCGAAYGGAGVATAGAGAASSGVAGVVAQLDPVVYNNYYEIDNSITNNIENHGDLDFNQQIGDGNVNVNDSTSTVTSRPRPVTGSRSTTRTSTTRTCPVVTTTSRRSTSRRTPTSTSTSARRRCPRTAQRTAKPRSWT